MANQGANSIYPQFMQLKKNQFRHSVNKGMVPSAKPPTKKQIQGDTPDPDAFQEQIAKQRAIRKMGAEAYEPDIQNLMDAYSTFGQGDGGSYDAGGNRGGGGFGGK
jgi:hypothetical protein